MKFTLMMALTLSFFLNIKDSSCSEASNYLKEAILHQNEINQKLVALQPFSDKSKKEASRRIFFREIRLIDFFNPIRVWTADIENQPRLFVTTNQQEQRNLFLLFNQMMSMSEEDDYEDEGDIDDDYFGDENDLDEDEDDLDEEKIDSEGDNEYLDSFIRSLDID